MAMTAGRATAVLGAGVQRVPWCITPAHRGSGLALCKGTSITQMTLLLVVCFLVFFVVFFHGLASQFVCLRVFDDSASVLGWEIRKPLASSAHKLFQLPPCRGWWCDIVGSLARALSGVPGVSVCSLSKAETSFSGVLFPKPHLILLFHLQHGHSSAYTFHSSRNVLL